jgi:hypothetical protein
VSNLEQLLRSRNVSPKAIAQVLPDVHASCAPLLDEITAFHAGLINATDQAALNELIDAMRADVALLETAIREALPRAVNASARLKLERRVTQVSRSLSGALPLAEALEESVRVVPQAVDVLETLALSRVGDQPQTLGAVEVQASVVASAAAKPVRSSPRLLLILMGLAGALVNKDRAKPALAITIHSTQSERFAATVEAEARPGSTFVALLPRPHAATATCVRAR